MVNWRKINGVERPELDEWRDEHKKLVYEGTWTWTDYKNAYKAAYNALPDVVAKRAARTKKWRERTVNGIPVNLRDAVVAARRANRDTLIPSKPCAICGRVGYRWLVDDGNAAPTDHPWYCRGHWVNECAKRKAARVPGVEAVGRDIIQTKGMGFAAALAKWLRGVSTKEAKIIWDTRPNKPAPSKPPAPPTPAAMQIQKQVEKIVSSIFD